MFAKQINSTKDFIDVDLFGYLGLDNFLMCSGNWNIFFLNEILNFC